MKKKSVEIEEVMSREKVADFLRKLAEGLQNGNIELKGKEEALTLSPSDEIVVEIEAKRKKDKSKFSMELSWREPAGQEGEDTADETHTPAETIEGP